MQVFVDGKDLKESTYFFAPHHDNAIVAMSVDGISIAINIRFKQTVTNSPEMIATVTHHSAGEGLFVVELNTFHERAGSCSIPLTRLGETRDGSTLFVQCSAQHMGDSSLIFVCVMKQDITKTIRPPGAEAG